MSDLITDAMVETATRANYDAATWPGAWAALDSLLQEGGGERAAMREALEAVAPLIAAKALRDEAETYTVTILDALGYKVRAVFTEDLMARADAIERGGS